MSGDDWLFGSSAPSQPAAPAATPSAPSGDPAIWTVLGEAGANVEGQRGVASTIAHRQQAFGLTSPDEVVSDPSNGYEAWQSKQAQLQKQYPVGSPAYTAAQNNVGGILAGTTPPPYPYTHFYSPSAQTAEGRKPPEWDNGTGVDIGGNQFFTLPLKPPPGLSPQQQAQWEDLAGGKQPVAMTPTPGTPKPGSPTDPQANAVRFLESQGLRDTGAAPGTSTNPLAETASSGPPTAPGSYFVDKSGALRVIGQDGKPSEDFMPSYQQLATQRAQAEAAPISSRLLTGGAQGFSDVANSVNKLTGGGLAASSDFPMGSALQNVNSAQNGGPNTYQMAQASIQGGVNQRNAFNLLHGGDPVASIGRVGAQMATVAPIMALGGAGTGAATDALGAAVPAMRGALDFLGGNAEGGLATRALSQGAAGVPQGAAVGALTSSTSDRPVGEQVATGAILGGGAGAAAPVAAATGSRLARGLIGPDIPQPIAQLATKAMDTYGIPLRTSQIAGTVDRNAAIKDSEAISQPLTGYAQNQAAQRTAFSKAVASTYGSDSAAHTPTAMSAARSSLGAKFQAFGASHNIPDADSVLTNLGAVVHDAQQSMPASDVAPLLKQVENIGSVIKPSDVPGQPGTIDGKAYLNLIKTGSPLDRAMQSGDSNLRYYAGKIKDALDDGMAQSATPQELADFSNTRLQYKNLMTIKGLAAKAGVTGEISPVQLQGMVNRSFDDRAFSGAGPLGDLADIGQTFMKEPPNSGTAPRLMDAVKRNLGTLGLGGGALGEAVFLHDPALAVKLGAGAAALGTLRLGGNAISGALGNSATRTRLMLGRGQPDESALRGMGLTTLRDYMAPAYVPGSALAGIELNRPQPGSSSQAGVP